jgi:Protein of unknown function (DUF3168)
MRTLEQVIFTTLGPLVANRVHPVVVPQDATFPCIGYQTVNAAPENSLCGSSGLVRSSVMFNLYAVEYADLRTLRESVIAAMQSFPLECILTMEQDGFEPDGKLFRRMLQYSIAEQE